MLVQQLLSNSKLVTLKLAHTQANLHIHKQIAVHSLLGALFYSLTLSKWPFINHVYQHFGILFNEQKDIFQTSLDAGVQTNS